MNRIRLDYGKGTIEAEIPDGYQTAVLNMKETRALDDPVPALKEKLRSPAGTRELAELCRKAKTACIVVSDKTRAAPNKILLPPILEILNAFSIKTKILVACGMHSPTVGKDLEDILGEEILRRYEVINHDARDKSGLVHLGEGKSGVAVYVNRIYCESDLKMLTGFIEPHFMAGFSGGRKSVCPGIAGMETIKYAHSPEVLESPLAKAGVLTGNPCSEFAFETAAMAGCDFIVNVTLTAGKEISGIFCGDLKMAFLEGVKLCEERVSAYVEEPVEVVVTSNGGYPLDRDFYQTVKGIVGALDIIKEGGTIIIASECRDGVGSKEFKEQLFSMKDIDEFMQMISREGYFCVDQWEVEELIKALRKCKIKLFAEYLRDEEIKKCWCEPVRDLNTAIIDTIKSYGKEAKAAIIPGGPYVLARLK